MLYEQQNSIAELKTEGVVATKLLEKEQAVQENELRRGIRNLKVGLKEQELFSENYIKDLKLVCASRGLLSDTQRLNSQTSGAFHYSNFSYKELTLN